MLSLVHQRRDSARSDLARKINATAYAVSRRFLVPVMSRTRPRWKERSEHSGAFLEGRITP
jgi:hypothetical protein